MSGFQNAFVIHTRLFRDTSLLVELFCEESGRVSVLAKGVRKNAAKKGSVIQPFIPLSVGFRGKSQLPLLTHVESISRPYFLEKNMLISGFYLNELLIKLMAPQDPAKHLFHIYQETLNGLEKKLKPEIYLRKFERVFLAELGYGLNFSAINPDCFYHFYPKEGFKPVVQNVPSDTYFSGKILKAIEHEAYDDPIILREAKRLFRMAFADVLEGRNLKSRALFYDE